MGYQPWLKKDPDSTLIRYNVRDPSSYKKYTDALEDYLERYDNTNNTRQCGGAATNRDETEEACRFELDQFRAKGCSKEKQFGYETGTPCVIVTLNRLIGWEPVPYPIDSEPEAIKGRYKSGDVGINCDGEYEPDAEHVGTIEYIPSTGIPGKYYPYKVMKNYHQPIAMVKFTKPPKNKVVLVECKAYAYNILHDSADRLGLVHFELLIEDKPVEDDEDERR
uniref:Sodium/potassium ATPase beta subunit n=1 Tax=Plectus sambesii TaxID=2011161 RepID=A0A914WGL0_9BILA